MSIEKIEIENERQSLKEDFDKISDGIKKMENDLKTARNNLNAVYGAIQQCDKFLATIKEKKGDNAMPKEKAEALAMATS